MMILPPYGLLGIDGLTLGVIAWTVAIFVVAFTVTLTIAGVLIVQMPADYFRDDRPREDWRARHPVLRWTLRVMKNLAGALLVGMGFLMLVTPGQGVLTILLGVMLLDLPGKRQVVRRLIGRPSVLRTVNRLRERFGKPPVELD